MKRAIISDIHGNLEALTAVLADIRGEGIETIYCLGDVIGYGPNPCECLDLLLDIPLCILGNHDQGALFDPEGFNSNAERAIFWTRDQLERPNGDPEKQARRWTYLAGRPRMHHEGACMFVHGSPRNPLNEYVFPEDSNAPRKMERLFALIRGCCFQGHTHVPGVFEEGRGYLHPSELSASRFHLGDRKTMVNVGSVGQPRDCDPRACYVIQDGDLLEFRRISYPVDETIAKILAIPELDDHLAHRLREGR